MVEKMIFENETIMETSRRHEGRVRKIMENIVKIITITGPPQ